MGLERAAEGSPSSPQAEAEGAASLKLKNLSRGAASPALLRPALSSHGAGGASSFLPAGAALLGLERGQWCWGRAWQGRD